MSDFAAAETAVGVLYRPMPVAQEVADFMCQRIAPTLRIGAGDEQLHHRMLHIATTYKFEWGRELARRERLAFTGHEPLPHPDHVVLDYRTWTLAVNGPMTKEKQAKFVEWRRRKADCEVELAELQELLAIKTTPCMREIYEEEIVSTKRVLEITGKVV